MSEHVLSLAHLGLLCITGIDAPSVSACIRAAERSRVPRYEARDSTWHHMTSHEMRFSKLLRFCTKIWPFFWGPLSSFISFPMKQTHSQACKLATLQPGLKCQRLSAFRPMNSMLRFTVALFTDPTRLGAYIYIYIFILISHDAAARLILVPGTACFTRPRLRWWQIWRRPRKIDPSISQHYQKDSKRSETITNDMNGTGTDTNKNGFAWSGLHCIMPCHASVHWQAVSRCRFLPIHWPRPRITCV